jgi:hypothetical protein
MFPGPFPAFFYLVFPAQFEEELVISKRIDGKSKLSKLLDLDAFLVDLVAV